MSIIISEMKYELTEEQQKEIRRRAYHLGLDSDLVVTLAEDCGVYGALRAISRTERFVDDDNQRSLFPKKTAGSYYAHEAKEVRRRAAENEKEAELVKEHEDRKRECESAYENGFRPDGETLLAGLQKQYEAGDIKWNEYNTAKQWLIDTGQVEEDTDDSNRDPAEIQPPGRRQ